MRVKNGDSKTRSYFVYNYEDTSQGIALASGKLGSGDDWDWTPPKNGSGYYIVVIKRDAGGGSIMAAGAGKSNATFTFNGYTLVVS
jgi:hypothetical protein